jgi:DNA-binding transcriptional ArsR family regulator
MTMVFILHMNICSPVPPMDDNHYLSLDEHTAAHVAELFRAFSDTSRVRILSALALKELNVSALAEIVGISESAVSHHMRSLRQMGLVNARRDGKEVYYRIEDEHIITLFNQGVKHVQNG